MDVTTLGAVYAMIRTIFGKKTQDSIQEYENTGLVMVDGKLCVKVERS